MTKEKPVAGKPKTAKKKTSKAEREKKQKEKEIRALILEVSFYVVFLSLLVTTASNNRDNKAFGYRHSTLSYIDANHAISKIRTPDQFWRWMHFTLIPFLYPSQDWNTGALTGDPRQVMTFASYRVGPLRIRQHRVTHEPCSINHHFESLGIRCVQSWSSSYVDTRHYNWTWDEALPVIEGDEFEGNWSAWNYRGWSNAGGIPIMGLFGVYPTGGYMLDISGSIQEATSVLESLESSTWIDPLTRFISVEFSLFCPGANLFAMVPVIFEFPQADIIMGKAHLYPFRLFSYVGGYPTAKMTCDVLVYAAIVWFIIREVYKVKDERLKYFTQMWNILELVNLILSITATVLYVGRHIVSTYVSKDIGKAKGQFYNFQTLAMWDELFNILLGFVCFLSTLQLLHLLRFNRRMSLLAATLKEAGKDLWAFFLVFILVFLAFVSFSYVIFGPNLILYSSVIRSVETLVTVSLGQFDYYALVHVNHIFAPLFLFLYMMFIVFILINMLITILNDAFAVVREDVSKQPNDYELVDYIMARTAVFLWSLNPVKTIWGKSRDVGLVKTDAPKMTQANLDGAPSEKKTSRRFGVNHRPRHRNRCTLNADLVRLHNRLDNINYLVGHFTSTIKEEISGMENFRTKTVSFKDQAFDECCVLSLSLNDNQEQRVPGILKIQRNSSSETGRDHVVPEHSKAPSSFQIDDDGLMVNDFRYPTLTNPSSEAGVTETSSHPRATLGGSNHSETEDMSVVPASLEMSRDTSPLSQRHLERPSDHIIVDMQNDESSL